MSFLINDLVEKRERAKVVLGHTKKGRPILVYYFPGRSPQNAMVIGGMHGSELSSVEVTKTLIAQLSSGAKPFYNVLVIPDLFPDNSATAESHPHEIGSVKNIGRYTNAVAADPNRQMPALGSAFNPNTMLDYAGRPIEIENTLLLQMIQEFKPERIASVHAIRNTTLAGIYADPRTDCNGLATGYYADSALAVGMALHIQNNNGSVPGNHLTTSPTSVYHTDPHIAPAGQVQKRTFHGNNYTGKRSYGVSLGSWASTAVCSDEGLMQRKATILLTIEFPGSKRPNDYAIENERSQCLINIQAYANAIGAVFLEEPEALISM